MNETGVDLVTGTRYLPGGGVYGWDLNRKMTSRVAPVTLQIFPLFLFSVCCPSQAKAADSTHCGGIPRAVVVARGRG